MCRTTTGWGGAGPPAPVGRNPPAPALPRPTSKKRRATTPPLGGDPPPLLCRNTSPVHPPTLAHVRDVRTDCCRPCARPDCPVVWSESIRTRATLACVVCLQVGTTASSPAACCTRPWHRIGRPAATSSRTSGAHGGGRTGIHATTMIWSFLAPLPLRRTHGLCTDSRDRTTLEM
jgi:hypothetical protein